MNKMKLGWVLCGEFDEDEVVSALTFYRKRSAWHEHNLFTRRHKIHYVKTVK